MLDEFKVANTVLDVYEKEKGIWKIDKSAVAFDISSGYLLGEIIDDKSAE